MSPTLMNTSMHMASSLRTTPPSDFLDRHEYGVIKNRTKPASTGGGRAWSEEEEVYLLQTRLQKMPYKHIAAHLKKTELACRLHYHQLSHGSNRRKRTASIPSAPHLRQPSRGLLVRRECGRVRPAGSTALLEDVWRRGGWCAPPTPCGSPEGDVRDTTEKRRSSISDLLGIDASPRSPRERELIKRLEEEGRMEMV
ncbi:hypothetical protein VE04_01045 [Pseudogymnoascus sp. 24MN13]|nr:hypothetical protein VE04_01045 [Pseudogymnoascus sp. 24MN13]